MNPNPSPNRFLINTIIIAAGVAIYLLTMSPSSHNLTTHAEARSSSTKPVSINQSSVVSKLTAKGTKPRLLFIYASWCPYCKRQFPDIEALAKKYENNVEIVAISTDKESEKLSRFLSNHPSISFTPYILSSGDSGSLARTLVPLGVAFSGGIPFTAVFNKEGKPVAQFGGLTDAKLIEQHLTE